MSWGQAGSSCLLLKEGMGDVRKRVSVSGTRLAAKVWRCITCIFMRPSRPLTTVVT